MTLSFKTTTTTTFQDPPCASLEHCYYTQNGWPCPICAAQKASLKEKREAAKAEQDRERFAELVTNKVVEKLRNP